MAQEWRDLHNRMRSEYVHDRPDTPINTGPLLPRLPTDGYQYTYTSGVGPRGHVRQFPSNIIDGQCY